MYALRGCSDGGTVMCTFRDIVTGSTGLSLLPETLTETVTCAQLPLSPVSRSPLTSGVCSLYHLVLSVTVPALVVLGV